MRSNEQDITAVRSEIKNLYQEFLEGDCRLPEDFSFAYDRTTASGYILRGTPFDAYLDGLWNEVDSLRNMTNISEWVRLSAGAEINAAAGALVTWVKKTREMTEVLQEKCRIGHTTIMMPVFPCCTRRVMVVLEDEGVFAPMSEETAELCKTVGISFCIVRSDRKYFDLMEQREWEIEYQTYPNYHDETYADWCFR